jgi:hypothetical protein
MRCAVEATNRSFRIRKLVSRLYRAPTARRCAGTPHSYADEVGIGSLGAIFETGAGGCISSMISSRAIDRALA